EYSNDDLGRVFFPLNNYSDTVRFTKGDKNYPFIPAMDTIFARDTNRVGDAFEIAASSDYAFDSKGIYNLQYGIPIISPYTPVHYSLEIIGVVKSK
ncbi:MAG: hypothetical protein MI922_29405, partial [Bacteroidales bacterium]|nr:hypothetical protein [Bacteroidales bacterium]